MKHRTLMAGAALATAVALPMAGATPAHAAGKGSLQSSCSSFQTNSSKSYFSAVCRTPGKYYRVEAKFGYYSAGHGGTVWRSSAWTKVGYRATVSGGGAYLIGTGSTIYWK